MTCNRKNAKRLKGIKYTSIALILLAHAFFDARPSISKDGGIDQFQYHDAIGGRLPTTILMVGWKRDESDINKLLKMIVSRAGEAFSRLDWQNPQSAVSKLNASAGQGPLSVPPDVLAAFQAAEKVAKWSGGAFDISYAGAGDYRDIKVDPAKSTVELKKPGMQVRFDGIIEGFLADLMVRYVYSSNMRNAMVKVGNVFRGLGSSISGPWKIQVQDDAGTFARHALNLTVMDTGVATVSASQFRGIPITDPRSKSSINAPCKGVVIIMRDAALAQGIAQAAFVLGPKTGLDLMARAGNTKGMIVDNNGQFIRSPGFK